MTVETFFYWLLVVCGLVAVLYLSYVTLPLGVYLCDRQKGPPRTRPPAPERPKGEPSPNVERPEPPPAPPDVRASFDRVTVSADALRQLLEALNGPGYLIRELQYTRNIPIGEPNPIDVLVGEYNRQADEYNKNTG